MSTLEVSIANLEKEFRCRDPYHSGVVSRSEFTFVLVRNGGMLTQIDALADRFAMGGSDGGQSPPMLGAASSVDYRRFMAHMRALADGRDGEHDGSPGGEASPHRGDDARTLSSPPTRRDLSPELQGHHQHRSDRMPQATPSDPWRYAVPSASSVTVAAEAAAAAHHAMWSSPAPPSPTPGAAAAAIDMAHKTCYDRMEEMALRASATAVGSAARAAAGTSRDAESDATRHEAPSTHASSATSSNPSLPTQSVGPRGTVPRAASSPPPLPPQPPHDVGITHDAVRSAAACPVAPTARKASVHMSLKDVFRIIQSRRAPDAAGGTSSETIRIAEAFEAFRDAGVPGVSLPQLEALCDGIARESYDDDDDDGSPRITAEELCTLVSRLPPKTIGAIRLTATWERPQQHKHKSLPDDVHAMASGQGTAPPQTLNRLPHISAAANAVEADASTTPQDTSRALEFHPQPNHVSPLPQTLATYTYTGGQAYIADGRGAPTTCPPAVMSPEQHATSTPTSSRRGSYAARQRAQQELLHQHQATDLLREGEENISLPINAKEKGDLSALGPMETVPTAEEAAIAPTAAAPSRFQQPTKSSALKLKRGGQHPRGATGSVVSANVSERGSSRGTSRPSSARSSRTSSPSASTRGSTVANVAQPHSIAVERVSIALSASASSTSASSRNRVPQPMALGRDNNHIDRQHMRPLPWDRASSAAQRHEQASGGRHQAPTASLHPADRRRRDPLVLPTSRSSRSTSGEEGRQSSVPVSTAAVELSPMSQRGTPHRGEDAYPHYQPPATSSAVPSRRLADALGGRCNHVMSLCSNVDRTQSGLVRTGQITAILLALAPGIAAHELRAMLSPYHRGEQRSTGRDGGAEDMYDYVQLVGDLIIAGTPQRGDSRGDACSPQAAIPTAAAAAGPRTWDIRSHHEPQLQVSSPWSEKSPTPQPRQPLGYRAVNPSDAGNCSNEKRGERDPRNAAAAYEATEGNRRRSVSSSPRPIQMIPTMRRSSPSPSMERGASLEHLPLEERVRIGRERIKRLLKQELLNAASYDVHTLLDCFTAVDVGRRGYVDEKEFRHAMVELFRVGRRQLPKWAMDRAVKVAKRPFELLELQSDTSVSLTAAEKASRTAAQRYVSLLPSSRVQPAIAATCDYKFLLSELELAVY